MEAPVWLVSHYGLPASCPLSPNICKSLKPSGLDLSVSAGPCQTSQSERWPQLRCLRSPVSVPVNGFCLKALDGGGSAVSRVVAMKTIQKTKQKPRGWST